MFSSFDIRAFTQTSIDSLVMAFSVLNIFIHTEQLSPAQARSNSWVFGFRAGHAWPAQCIVDAGVGNVIGSKNKKLKLCFLEVCSLCSDLQFFKGSSQCQHNKSAQQEHVIVFSQNLNISIVTNDSHDAKRNADNPCYFFR